MSSKDFMLVEYMNKGKMIVFSGCDSKKCLNVEIFEGMERKAKYHLPTKDDVQCLYDTLGKYLNGEFGRIE